MHTRSVTQKFARTRLCFDALHIKILLVLWLTVPAMVTAQEVMISPGTILLTQSKRSDVITVGSGADSFATFGVTDAFFIQSGDGQLRAVAPREPKNSALSWLRVGPRKFSTEPGTGMQVRVAARPPADLAPGEYRLHLLIINRGSSEPQRLERPNTTQEGAVSVEIPMMVSHGVRILFRNKVQPEGGRLEFLRKEPNGPYTDLVFDVVRLGMTSLIGKYQIFTRSNGRDQDLGREFGVSVYEELDRRRFTTKVQRSDIPDGSLLCARLIFTDAGNPDLKPVEACTP